MLILIDIFVLLDPISTNASHIQVYIGNVVSNSNIGSSIVRNNKFQVVRFFTGQGMKMKIKLSKDSARKDNGVSTQPLQ